MTIESSNKTNHYSPFLEPYKRLYSEGLLSLTKITDLYLEAKAKNPKGESCAAFKKVLSLCVEAKEEYHKSKTFFGRIAKIRHDFLTGIGIETSLEKARKVLNKTQQTLSPNTVAPTEVVTQKLSNHSSDIVLPIEVDTDKISDDESSSSSSSSSASSGSGSAQSASGEDNESKIDFQAQLKLARHYAANKNEFSIFTMKGSEGKPKKIIMANPNNGDVYVLPLQDARGVDLNPIGKTRIRKGQNCVIYEGELHRVGNAKPISIAIATTIHKDVDKIAIAINNKENNHLQRLKFTDAIKYYAYLVTQVSGQVHTFAIMPYDLPSRFTDFSIPEKGSPALPVRDFMDDSEDPNIEGYDSTDNPFQ